jgi:hypothetical protein
MKMNNFYCLSLNDVYWGYCQKSVGPYPVLRQMYMMFSLMKTTHLIIQMIPPFMCAFLMPFSWIAIIRSI